MDFGFLFCRFVRFYHFTDTEVLQMPVTRFWFMERQIPRISAVESLNELPLVQCSMGGDHAKEFAQKQRELVGTVYDVRPEEYVETDEATKELLRSASKKRLNTA